MDMLHDHAVLADSPQAPINSWIKAGVCHNWAGPLTARPLIIYKLLKFNDEAAYEQFQHPL